MGDSPYIGFAPTSEILFVNNVSSLPGQDDSVDGGISTAVCDATAWMFKQAGTKPIVVNISLGADEGPHDGSSLAGERLDTRTGPGKIIVAAAGNEGDGGVHEGSGEAVRVRASGVAGSGKDRQRFVGWRLEWSDVQRWHD